MTTTIQRGLGAVMIIAATWTVPTSWAAIGVDAVRTVQGDVVAVNLQSTPHVIMVTVVLPSKQEMLVGATVGSGVAITRGKQAIGLDGISVGQTVSLTYVKNENGLEARSIHVQK